MAWNTTVLIAPCTDLTQIPLDPPLGERQMVVAAIETDSETLGVDVVEVTPTYFRARLTEPQEVDTAILWNIQ